MEVAVALLVDAIEGPGAREGDKEGVGVGKRELSGGAGRGWGLKAALGHCGAVTVIGRLRRSSADQSL